MATKERWPKCAQDGCERGACLRFASPWCYPHSLEAVARGDLKLEMTDADWAEEVLVQWSRAENDKVIAR